MILTNIAEVAERYKGEHYMCVSIDDDLGYDWAARATPEGRDAHLDMMMDNPGFRILAIYDGISGEAVSLVGNAGTRAMDGEEIDFLALLLI